MKLYGLTYKVVLLRQLNLAISSLFAVATPICTNPRPNAYRRVERSEVHVLTAVPCVLGAGRARYGPINV